MHNKLTKEDFRKLQEELDWRFGTVRAEIAHEKMIAAAHGDRSENAEYKAACEEYRKNDNRIQYLMNMLFSAELIEESDFEDDALGINRRARVRFSDMDEDEVLKLVTTLERDPEKMYISIESVLGKALSGKKAGDTVEVSAPGGKYTVKILELLD